MQRLGLFATGALLLAACAGQPYEPSYGFALENLYGGEIPESQQPLLADGRLTEQELEQATGASNACVAALPGIESLDPFRWVRQDGNFTGGTVEFADGADRERTIQAAQECYVEYVGLVEFAWRDQYYFGEWTEENLLD